MHEDWALINLTFDVNVFIGSGTVIIRLHLWKGQKLKL